MWTFGELDDRDPLKSLIFKANPHYIFKGKSLTQNPRFMFGEGCNVCGLCVCRGDGDHLSLTYTMLAELVRWYPRS